MVYAFTTEGLVAITEGGVSQSLSAPYLEKTFRAVRDAALAEDWKSTIDSGEGWFLNAIDGEQWLLLGVPSAYTGDDAEYVYVFDLRTGAWTRWAFDALGVSCAAALAGRVYFGGADSGGAGVLVRSRQESEESPNADDDVDVSISSRGTAQTDEKTQGVLWPLTLTGAGSTDGQVGQWAVGDNGSKGIVTGKRQRHHLH